MRNSADLGGASIESNCRATDDEVTRGCTTESMLSCCRVMLGETVERTHPAVAMNCPTIG